MGFMDELKKIIHPYDDEDYDYEEDFEEPVKESRSPFEERREDRRSEERRSEDRHNKVVNIHATTQLKVVLVKPERFENASEIADHLKEKRTVVLNLESTNKDVARRLIDFLSGVAYAGEGKIKKVAANTYIITPYSVDIMGDLIDELHGMGFEQVVLTGVQFPNIITRKQEFAAAGGKSQEGRAALLAADISTWQARFDGSVVLWLSYPAQQCTDASDALGAPAVSLGMHNLIVTADTLDAAARGQLQQSAAEAGVQNVVICMIIGVVLMIATLLVIKAVVSKKHAGIFKEMAEANKAMAAGK